MENLSAASDAFFSQMLISNLRFKDDNTGTSGLHKSSFLLTLSKGTDGGPVEGLE